MANPLDRRQAGLSISFDRAASFYDRTRGFPPGVERQIAGAICRQAGLREGARLLELGVGTGRLALPLAGEGLVVFGVDLSWKMLEVLRGKDRAGRIRAVHGDITALPFAPASFDAVLAVHVLHLVGGWRQALAEAVRALRPGGCFLLGWGERSEDSPTWQVRQAWREIVHRLGGTTERPGEREGERIIVALEEMGLQRAEVGEAARWTVRVSPAGAVRTIAERIFSETWFLPERLHQEALEQLSAWVGRRYADPESPVETEEVFRVAWLRRG
jgi:ubiquinone/menaquinone biosynthesis C-methylase UbiE